MKKLCEEYASALYEIAEEYSIEDTVAEQIKELSGILSDNPDYVRLLDNPAIDKEKRTELAHEAFDSVQEYLKNFIMLLTEARRMNEFEESAKHFLQIYDNKHGIVRAEAVTAAKLDAKQLEQIKAKLEKSTGKTVILTSTLDSSVIGGIILKYDGKQIDMSIRKSLNSISEIIANTDI